MCASTDKTNIAASSRSLVGFAQRKIVTRLKLARATSLSGVDNDRKIPRRALRGRRQRRAFHGWLSKIRYLWACRNCNDNLLYTPIAYRLRVIILIDSALNDDRISLLYPFSQSLFGIRYYRTFSFWSLMGITILPCTYVFKSIGSLTASILGCKLCESANQTNCCRNVS